MWQGMLRFQQDRKASINTPHQRSISPSDSLGLFIAGGSFLLSVGIGLPCALERHLILRHLTAFVYRRSLSVMIRLRFCWCLRDLVLVDRIRIVNWSDHDGLLGTGSAKAA